MRKFFTFIVVFVMAFDVFAIDLKSSVCVIRRNDKFLDSLYTRTGDNLQDNGYLSAGRLMMNVKNSFGTGFVYKTQAGKQYVITNSHVVNIADYVTLEFYVENSAFRTDCKVLYSDDFRDLCLIECPKDFNYKPLMSYNGGISDGKEVYTAGFPGFNSEPLWQLGKGIVSNCNVNFGKYSVKDSMSVIQHTAQVDPGSSGGPLLILSVSESDSLYSVVGVNTWKAKRREGTNFSIKTLDLDSFINDYEKGKSKESLDSVSKHFEQSFLEGYESVAMYISTKYALSLSKDETSALMRGMTPSIGNEIRNGNPILGLQELIAVNLCDKFKEYDQFTSSSVSENGDTGIVTYNVKKDVIECEWVMESGNWKLSNVNIGNSKKKKKLGDISVGKKKYGLFEPVWDNMIGVSFSVPVDDIQGPGFYLDYSRIFCFYGVFDVEAGVQGFHYKEEKNKGLSNNTLYGFGTQFSIGGQLPICLNSFVVDPYITAGCGFNMVPGERAADGKYGASIFGVAKGGFKFGYQFKGNNMIAIGCEYVYRIAPTVKMAIKDFKMPNHGFSVSVVYVW
ncbi:MAG: serine protease [Paludibacteraceae bacterium]|nr:serine protease [Paludibacteraceae bacterium]